MHNLTIQIDTEQRLALRRYAAERDLSLGQAVATALRDWLIGHGYLDVEAIDEETVTEGSA